MSSGITDVLNSFSVNQLKDLAYAMSSRGFEIPKRNLGRDDLLNLFKARKMDKTLILFAHRVEAVTPYKHLFVYSLEGSLSSVANIKMRIEAAYPGLVGGVRESEITTDGLEPQACLLDDIQSRIYLKLVHQVEMSSWVTVSRTEKTLKEFRKRHPVVITVRPLEGLLTIAFPGFTYTQGVQHDDRLTYSLIAAQGIEFLKKKFNVECKPFSAKPAIDALLEEEPNEVSDIKRNVRPKKGGRFAFDAGEEGKITTALTEFLGVEGHIAVTETQIRDLLRKSGASDIVLMWKRLQILTRVALLHDGPEFLFIWRDSGPSSIVVDHVLRKLVSYEKFFTKPGLEIARKQVFASSLSDIVKPSMIAQQFGISRSEALEILNIAVVKGDFQPRFRVNTDSLLTDFANTWRKSLTEFPSIVVDEDGNHLNLSLPSQIEVAFQRVK